MGRDPSPIPRTKGWRRIFSHTGNPAFNRRSENFTGRPQIAPHCIMPPAGARLGGRLAGLQLTRPNRNARTVVPAQMTSQTRPEGGANRSVRGVYVRIGDDRERSMAKLVGAALG